jgi:hypothetical protein
MLVFESKDGDKRRRILTPLKVTSTDAAGYENVLNAYRDHHFRGQFSTGLRMNRFHSLVQLNKTYNIDYTGTIPRKMFFHLQAATKWDHVIFKQIYTSNKAIRVTTGFGTVIKPKVVKPGETYTFKNSDPCGTNFYVLSLGYVVVKMTGEEKCTINLRETNTVRGSVRYAMTIDEFFNQNGE